MVKLWSYTKWDCSKSISKGRNYIKIIFEIQTEINTSIWNIDFTFQYFVFWFRKTQIFLEATAFRRIFYRLAKLLSYDQYENLLFLNTLEIWITLTQTVFIYGQAKYKVKNHASDFNLPSKPNEKGWLKTPRTYENIEGFKDEIKKLVLRGERIEGTYRKGEPDQFSAIHFYDSVSGCNAIFKQETKEFVSAWKLNQEQLRDLWTNKNIGDY